MRRRRYAKKIWVVLGLILACGVAYYFYSGSSEDASHAKGVAKSTPVPVGIASVKTGDIDVYLSGLGNITPTSTVTVHTLVNGELMRILFHEGQLVKKDQLLAEIDARPIEAQLEQAEGQLTRDEALLKEARIDLQRYTTLFAQDSIAKQQLDLQTSLVQQYEGAVQNDKGLIDAAKVQLIYTKITSPVNGRVGLRQVDLGNIVHTTDTNGIVVVTELQPITAIFTLPEDNIPTIMEHMKANDQLIADAWDRSNKIKIATGVLIAADNEVDPSTGMVKYRAEFPNKDNSLFPSQFVNIRLRLETLKGVLLIPTAAVQRGTQGTFVYLVKPDQTVAVQPVTLGTSEGEIVEVQKGLKEGDQVVIDGTDNLRDGAKIILPSAKDDGAKKDKDGKQDKDKDASHSKHKKHSDSTDN